MILYRVQHQDTSQGPFSVVTRNRSLLWEDGPTPREELWDSNPDSSSPFTMQGKLCAVHRPHLLPQWFPDPAGLAKFGLVLTVWDVPDDAYQAWNYQAVFSPDEPATIIRTIPLPEQWEDIFDLLNQEG